jgi:hypothetical protein
MELLLINAASSNGVASKAWNLFPSGCIQHHMKRAKPFPSLSLMLPDDIAEDADSGIASYWKQDNNNCLLQILFREWGPQVSALHHLPERTSAGGEWQAVSLAGTIEGCPPCQHP